MMKNKDVNVNVVQSENVSQMFDEFELPGGLVDVTGQLHKDVELDEMRGIDEEILTSSRYKGKMNLALHHMLARVVKRIGSITDVKVSVIRQLLVGDRDYILLRLQEWTNGIAVDTEVPCPTPDCDYTNKLNFSLEQIPVKELDKGKRTFTVELPKGIYINGKVHKEVIFDLPTSKISESMEIYINRKEFTQGLTLLFMESVKSIGSLDKKDLTEDIFKYMSSKDRKFLIDEINTRQPGPEYTTVKYVCEKCGQEHSFDVASTNFFG